MCLCACVYINLEDLSEFENKLVIFKNNLSKHIKRGPVPEGKGKILNVFI